MTNDDRPLYEVDGNLFRARPLPGLTADSPSSQDADGGESEGGSSPAQARSSAAASSADWPSDDFDPGTLSAEPAAAFVAEEELLDRIYREAIDLQDLQQSFDVVSDSLYLGPANLSPPPVEPRAEKDPQQLTWDREVRPEFNVWQEILDVADGNDDVWCRGELPPLRDLEPVTPLPSLLQQGQFVWQVAGAPLSPAQRDELWTISGPN